MEKYIEYRKALKKAEIKTFSDIKPDFLFFREKAIEYDNPHMLEWVNHVIQNEYVQGTRHVAFMYLLCELMEKYTYDKRYVQIIIDFTERSLGATQGSGGIKLAPIQHLLFGVYYGLNRGNYVVPNILFYLVGRGNGKSSVTAIISALDVLLNKEVRSDIVVLANTTKQAKILYNFATTTLHTAKSPYSDMVDDNQLRVTRDGIRNNTTFSELSVRASDSSSLDGLSAVSAILDEVHEAKINLVPVVTQGSRLKLPDLWRALIITTDGTLRDYAMDELKDKADKVLFGEAEFVDFLPMCFTLDVDDDFEDDTLWCKSNPMLGSIVSMKSLKDLYNSALSSPTEMTQFKAKILNIPQKEFESYFYAEDIEQIKSDDFDQRWYECEDYCSIGIDMSINSDMTAISFVKRDMFVNKYYVKTLSYMTKTAFQKLPEPVQERLMGNNDLTVMDIEIIDHTRVYQDVMALIKQDQLAPVAFMYDAYRAQIIIEKLRDSFEHTGAHIIEVPQTVRGISATMATHHTLVQEGAFKSDSKTLAWTMENVRTKFDANNQPFPNKQKSEYKIDTYVSTLTAMAFFKDIRAMDYFSHLD